jgi:hypothetical protein
VVITTQQREQTLKDFPNVGKTIEMKKKINPTKLKQL